jgi:hypothetical protein
MHKANSIATTDVAADYDPTADRITINRKSVDPHLGWHLASLFNLLNFMPVINVPTGVAANKVPTGMQITAQSWYHGFSLALAVLREGAANIVALLGRARIGENIANEQGRGSLRIGGGNRSRCDVVI